LSAKCTGRLYPRRNPWYSLSEDESTSGHVVLSGVPRKKSPVTPPGIDPGTSRLAVQCLNHYASPGPTCLHTNYKMPNSNVALVITITHKDNKIFMFLPCYMTFCRTTNDCMQIALRFYASAKVQLVITHLGYCTVFIGSPLPLFQDSIGPTFTHLHSTYYNHITHPSACL